MYSWLSTFLEIKESIGCSSKTLTSYKANVERFLEWLNEGEISRTAIQQYVIHLSKQDLSLTTRNSYVRDVITFTRWLFDEELVSPFSTRGLKPRLPKKKPESYTLDQLHKLLDGASLRDRAMMLLFLDTGIRAGELAQLNRTSINFDTGAFTVIGKGNKERVSWASPPVLDAIRAYLQTRNDTDDCLWLSRLGQPLSMYGIHQVIQRRAEAVGIRDEVRRLVHSFRATFAKHYVQRGGDLESLRKLLGHESLVMSAHYAQLANDELAKQKARINPLGMLDLD